MAMTIFTYLRVWRFVHSSLIVNVICNLGTERDLMLAVLGGHLNLSYPWEIPAFLRD